MLTIKNNVISLTRGDSARIALTINKEDGTEYTPQDGDQILFTVKKNTRTAEILFQHAFHDSQIYIVPQDTENLKYGDYVYDVQLTKVDGAVMTIVPPNTIKVLEEVTWNGE